MSLECVCGGLDRYKFPVFQPSTEEYRYFYRYHQLIRILLIKTFRAANLFASGQTTVKAQPRSQEQANSDKLTDLSQESDILGPSKSEFSLAPQHMNANSQDNEIVLEISDDKSDNKGSEQFFCF